MLPTMVLRAAAAVVVSILGSSSARNMYQMQQTLWLLQNQNLQDCNDVPPKQGLHQKNANTITWSQIDTMDHHRLLLELKQMKRQELLHLFLTTASSQKVPPSEALHGDWDGILLDNNSWIMTKVTAFITHQLFGQGRTWNGKAFLENGFGMNRFQSTTNTSRSRSHLTKEGDSNRFLGKITDDRISLQQHGFDFSVGAQSVLDGKPCISLDYHKHQSSPLSPWRSMNDELRQLSPDILLGFGYMVWSGGKLNAAPFCLIRVATTTATGSDDAHDTTKSSEQCLDDEA